MDMTKIPFGRKYNLIYGSWAFGYLSDEEIFTLLEKAKQSLMVFNGKPGMIIIKENTRKELDENDKDVRQQMAIRTKEHYLDIFKTAGYNILKYSVES